MKDGQKQYRILRIDEPDFGCEGRDDGEAAYDEITLVNEQGETCLVRMEEQQVWNMGLDEEMLVWVGEDGQIRGRCKRMDISRWSEKYQVRALTEQDVGDGVYRTFYDGGFRSAGRDRYQNCGRIVQPSGGGGNPHRAPLLGERQPSGRAFLEKKSVRAGQRNTEYVGTNGHSGRTEVEINFFL